MQATQIPSVILLSGGLDSSANLAFCAERDHAVLAVHCDYGQRAEASEWRACQALASYYGVPLVRVDVRWLGALGGSSLTDVRMDVPEPARGDLDTMSVIEKSAKSVWVPNRNGVLIQIAVAHAERQAAARVVVGFNREEATTFPDNSQAFLDASSFAQKYSTRNGVEAFCYTTAWDKREIVRELAKLKRRFPHELVWSCYHSGEAPCGKCESCGRHDRALAEAGFAEAKENRS